MTINLASEYAPAQSDADMLRIQNGIKMLLDLAFECGLYDQVVAERDMVNVPSVENTERANVHIHGSTTSAPCDIIEAQNAG